MREPLEPARRSGSNDQLATTFVNYADALHLAGRGEDAAEVAGLIARARLPRGAAGDAGGGDAGAGGGDRSGVGGTAADEDPFGLTPRERQVLTALAAGATNREIAASLHMAEKTASVHVSASSPSSACAAARRPPR